MSSHARHYTTLLQSSQRPLCRSETGERKKESARGIMGRGEIRGRCRLSLFPSSTTRSLFLSIIAIFIGISIGSLCAEERNSSMRNGKEKCDASKIKICEIWDWLV